MSEWIQLDIEEWISLQEDSPVSPTVSQVSKTQRTIANSGLKCLELLKKSDPPTSLERMSEILLASEKEWYSNRCVLTWKVKATKCKRMYYLLQAKTLPISDTGVGLSVSWPTPKAGDHVGPEDVKRVFKNKQGYSKTRKKSGVRYGASLPDAVNYENKMFPTPTTQEIEHPNAELTKTGRRKSKDGKSSHSLNLADTVKMWPTHAAHEGRLGYQRRDTGKKGTQKSLTTIVIDSQGGREKTTGQLNPQWVEWLMGYPIGWTDLKD